uniref:Uncharacterized protein n=2 Tax=Oryza TaxID=4527 RepID=A0A0D3HKW9_9ORYZ
MAAAVTPLVSTSRLGTDPEPTVRSLYDDGDACLNDGYRSAVAVDRSATCGIQREMLQGEEAGHRGIDLARAQGEAAATTG